ncbi:MAG: hypothetical protein FWC41_02955 [Firmicutes bacterium]|nr:hypothetical protein [Bacillota bacterium]
MENKEISISDIKDKIQDILNNVHNNSTKRTIIKHSDRLSFACPICMDSHKTPSKKRGNLYLDSLYYKCYNCGKYCSILSFFKEFNVSISLQERTIINELMKEKSFSFRNNTDDIEGIKDFLIITKDDLIKKLRLINVVNNSISRDYIQYRKIPKKWWDSIYYNYGHYYILNILKFEDVEYVISYIQRTTNENFRYLQRTYKDVLDLFDNSELLEHKHFEQFNNFSGYFNLYNVDLNRIVYVCESAFDAMFLGNAIALNGVNKRVPFECENYHFILDNDEIGLKKMRKLLKEESKVFMWKKFINDFGLENHNIKDVNDLFFVLIHKKIDVKELKFKEYFTNNTLGGLYV